MVKDKWAGLATMIGIVQHHHHHQIYEEAALLRSFAICQEMRTPRFIWLFLAFSSWLFWVKVHILYAYIVFKNNEEQSM